MKVLVGAGWRDGIKNICGMRDSRSLYLTLDFVCLWPQATQSDAQKEMLEYTKKKKKKQTWDQVY